MTINLQSTNERTTRTKQEHKEETTRGGALWQAKPPGNSGGVFQAAKFATTPPAASTQPAAPSEANFATG